MRLLYHAMVVILILQINGCTGSADSTPLAYGNPAGYTVHWLSGDSLSSKTAFVNGLSIDTSTIDSINTSVQAIIDSTNAPATVTEVSGQNSDFTIDFTAAAAPVPATFYGMNVQWSSKFYLTNPLWLALASNLHLDIIRFPGGQERIRYDGISSTAGTPASDRLTVTGTQPYEYRLSGDDLKNFIQFCTDQGIAAEPEVNLTVDDANMWKQEVLDIGNLGYDLKYISAGNEPDIDSWNGNWPYWGATRGNQSTAPVAIGNYVTRYQEYYTALSAAKPGMTYAFGELGVAISYGYGPIPYIFTLLGEPEIGQPGFGQPGCISGHWYMLGNHGQDSGSSDFPSIDHMVIKGNSDNNIDYLSDVVSTIRSTAVTYNVASPKIFIGEWGVSYSATPADAGIEDCLATAIFNAEAQEYAKTLGVDSMFWMGLSDPTSTSPWVPALLAVDNAGRMILRPQYYIYFMYKYFYGDHIVTVPGGQNTDWSVYASSDSSGSYLMLINRNASVSYTKVVSVTTVTGTKQLRLKILPHSVTTISF